MEFRYKNHCLDRILITRVRVTGAKPTVYNATELHCASCMLNFPCNFVAPYVTMLHTTMLRATKLHRVWWAKGFANWYHEDWGKFFTEQYTMYQTELQNFFAI